MSWGVLAVLQDTGHYKSLAVGDSCLESSFLQRYGPGRSYLYFSDGGCPELLSLKSKDSDSETQPEVAEGQAVAGEIYILRGRKKGKLLSILRQELCNDNVALLTGAFPVINLTAVAPASCGHR